MRAMRTHVRGGIFGAVLGTMAVGALLVPAWAQGPTDPSAASETTASGKAERSMSDPAFLNRAIMIDHGAVDAANLALKKASDAKTREVAQHVLQTHTEMLQQLKGVAKTMGWKYRDAAGPKSRESYAKLERLSGAEFDKAFMEEMIQMHRREVGMFEAESGNAHNEALMKISGEQLPILRQHLQELEGVQKSGV